MNMHDFVLSDRKNIRWFRHTVFWIGWWLILSVILYAGWDAGTISGGGSGVVKSTALQTLQQSGTGVLIAFTLIKSFFFLFIHITACYAFIYIVLPRFLQRKKYFEMLSGTLLIVIFLASTGYFIQNIIFPSIDNAFQLPFAKANGLLWTSLKNGLLNAPKIIGIASIIQLFKFRWQKQQEQERLEREVMATELELLKTQVHPQFLFNTLDNIYSSALEGLPETPVLLLKLADILSYMLYECNDPLAPLEKDIVMLRDYMTLEKIRFADKLEMNIHIAGDTAHKRIAPLLLLHFIEHSFKQCESDLVEQPWINLDIRIETNLLVMKLMNGNPPALPAEENNDLSAVKKQLDLLYHGAYELKINQADEIFMVNLKINMDESMQEIPAMIMSNELLMHQL